MSQTRLNAKAQSQTMHNLHHAVTKSLATIGALNRAMFDEQDVGAYFDDVCDNDTDVGSILNSESSSSSRESVQSKKVIKCLSVQPIVKMYVNSMQEFTDCSVWRNEFAL